MQHRKGIAFALGAEVDRDAPMRLGAPKTIACPKNAAPKRVRNLPTVLAARRRNADAPEAASSVAAAVAEALRAWVEAHCRRDADQAQSTEFARDRSRSRCFDPDAGWILRA